MLVQFFFPIWPRMDVGSLRIAYFLQRTLLGKFWILSEHMPYKCCGWNSNTEGSIIFSYINQNNCYKKYSHIFKSNSLPFLELRILRERKSKQKLHYNMYNRILKTYSTILMKGISEIFLLVHFYLWRCLNLLTSNPILAETT